jgi:hypothetical protein
MVKYDIKISRQIFDKFSKFFSFMMGFTILFMNFQLLFSGAGCHCRIFNPSFSVRTRTFMLVHLRMNRLKWPQMSLRRILVGDNYVGARRGEFNLDTRWRRVRKGSPVDPQSVSLQKSLIFWYVINCSLLCFPPSPSRYKVDYKPSNNDNSQLVERHVPPIPFLDSINTAPNGVSCLVQQFSVMAVRLLLFDQLNSYKHQSNSFLSNLLSSLLSGLSFAHVFIVLYYVPIMQLQYPTTYNNDRDLPFNCFLVNTRPHPSYLLFGKGFSSDTMGDGPSVSLGEKQWTSININFRLLTLTTATATLMDFTHAAVLSFFGRVKMQKWYIQPASYWYDFLAHSRRLDLLHSVKCFFDHGPAALTEDDIRLIAHTSMDDILRSWRGTRMPSHFSIRLVLFQYFSYLDSIGPFGDECWITVHASLCWLMDPLHTYSSPSPSMTSNVWQKMEKLRGNLISQLKVLTQPRQWSLSEIARQTPRIVMSLPSVVLPPPPHCLPQQPKWEVLQIASITSVPPPEARRLLWKFCALATESYFRCDLNKILFPYGFCDGFSSIYDILTHCNYLPLLPCACDFSKPTEETDLFVLYQVVATPMDALLSSWRTYLTSDPLTDVWWDRYLSLLESFGPFGEESWVTVHLSTLWLLDYSLLGCDTPPYSSFKFRDRWRSMVLLRRRFNSEILRHIQYLSPSSNPSLLPRVVPSIPIADQQNILDPVAHDRMNLGLCTSSCV